jgi:hypothetical protein
MSKNQLAVIELILGSIILVVAIWSTFNLYNCPADTSDCESWALFGVVLVAPVSILFLISGFVLYKYNSWYSQLAIIPIIIWCIYWWLM